MTCLQSLQALLILVPSWLSLTQPRKLILLRKSNLRNFRVPRLFLCEDVPPDHKLPTHSRAVPGAAASSIPATGPPTHPLLPSSKGKFSSTSLVQRQSHLPPPLGSSRSSSPRQSPSPASHLHICSRASTPMHYFRSGSPAASDLSASSSSTFVQGSLNI